MRPPQTQPEGGESVRSAGFAGLPRARTRVWGLQEPNGSAAVSDAETDAGPAWAAWAWAGGGGRRFGSSGPRVQARELRSLHDSRLHPGAPARAPPEADAGKARNWNSVARLSQGQGQLFNPALKIRPPARSRSALSKKRFADVCVR